MFDATAVDVEGRTFTALGTVGKQNLAGGKQNLAGGSGIGTSAPPTAALKS